MCHFGHNFSTEIEFFKRSTTTYHIQKVSALAFKLASIGITMVEKFSKEAYLYEYMYVP